MAGMEIDSLPLGAGTASSLSLRDRIVQKIVRLGIPLDEINPTPSSLVNIINANEFSIPNLVTFILPTDEEVTEILKSCKKDTEGGSRNAQLKDIYSESLLWIQWLMFKCDPEKFLHDLAQKSADNRAVCGSIWGLNELAYRCRTCEHDPTCAICVPCFQNGDHKDHDYSVIYTGGGCCDCGDESAWKIEGFCSKHKGIKQIQPLSQELADSAGPVLDIVFSFWRDKVASAEHWKRAKENGWKDLRKFANEFSSNVIRMLLEFCNCSESLLSFISKRIIECSGLLDILIRAERFLGTDVVKKLHELLLKLLGEPLFKYEIAKALVPYYWVNVNEAIKENSDSVVNKYTLLPSFSVQIFTVPALTTRLVKEVDLLGTLLGCLTNLFISCLGEDGLIWVNKWANMYGTTIRLIEDIRYVMSHSEVPIYITQERPDITRTWLKLLSLVQGMDPQKRETGIHIEEDNENANTPFTLCHLLGNIHPLLVGGAFSVIESMKTYSNVKNKHIVAIGELREESSSQGNCLNVPDSATWFIVTCLKFIEDWLMPSSESRRNTSLDAFSSKNRKFSSLRKKLFRITTNSNDASSSFLSRVGLSEEALTPDDDDPMDISETRDLITQYFSKNPTLDDNHGDINSSKEPGLFKLFSSGDWPDIEYDVSSQEISFHVPLHHLLSFLLRRALNYIYEDKLIEDNALASSRQLNFFEQVLKGTHPYGFSAYIMETPLRLRVFCAQVRAGMWRRNGDTAFIGREWYRSVQWLETGLEPDLFLLQCCAALAPSDLFIKRIQQRYGLTSYTGLDLAYHNEYESVLVQEMLTLIMQIVKERRYCGLSIAENLRREMIYRLAIGDATHSQLLKSLPQDVSNCQQLRNILDTIAVFSQPSAMKQGKYSLRKEAWKELDLYHPRWSSRDLQMAEERYFRFCEVSALNAQLPKWSPLFEPLNPISNIATSKSTSQIVRAVIFYAIFSERSSSSRAPDGVLITALHLLYLALDICETQSSLNQSCCLEVCPFFGYAIEEFTGAMDEIVWRNQSLLSLLIALMKKHKKGNDHDIETKHCNISSLIENLLKKFAKLNTACMEFIKRGAPDTVSDIPHCSLSTNLSTTSDAKDWKTKAREHQAAIMAKMKASQSKFIASLSSEPNVEPDDSTQSDQRMRMTEFDHVPDESAPVCSLCRDSKSDSPLCILIHLQKSRLTSFIDRGPISWDGAEQSGKEENQSKKESLNEQSSHSSNTSDFMNQNVDDNFAYDIKRANKYAQLLSLWHPEASYSSSLCSTSLEMLENDVYQHVLEKCATQLSSNALSKGLNAASSKAVISHRKNIPLDVSESTVPVKYIKFGPINCDGIHISSCGHAVHQECHDRYLLSLKQRHLRRLGFEGGHIVDPDLGELLCPVCRRFANSLLPAYPSTIFNIAQSQVMPSIQSQRDDIHVPFALCLLENTAKMFGDSIYQKALFTKQNDIVKPSLEPCLRKLFTLYSSNSFDTLLVSGKLIQSLVLWDTLLYSIKSAEVAARGKPKTCLTSSLSLDDLYKELRSSDCILTLLLCAAQNTRMSCHRDALLRFRGLQFLAGSICYGVSGDKSERGTFLSFFESPDESFLDIMFFKHVADPILCHDPFTSLMWAIYCLPSLFLYSKEIFNSFVQLFYTVCVVQALVTCYSSHSVDVSCLDGYMLKDVYDMTLQSEHVRKFFVSNYINDSCHPKDMIRRFTFPYLRRCALLWKMLQSSLQPLHESSQTCQVNPCANSSDDDNPISAELNGIKELEDMFQIQSLELVLKNSAVHTLALKWLEHFCEEFNARNRGTTLFSSPAVPFKLIQLPRLYQDLLQRYINVSCSSCSTILQEPALCLLCGKLCSAHWQSCCRASKCLIHATNCGAGIGVFLLVRKTTVFLQRSMRESSWHSPYLDAFGEEDVGLSRGRPLYLNEERYATLTYLVASHGLDRASEVLRQTTININGPE